jgi:Fe-Mn family superoxide dismutase
MERRDFLKAASALTTTALVSEAFATPRQNSSEKKTKEAFTYEHQSAPLKFRPANLKGLSEKLIVSHWENNYGGSVKALNEVRKKLNELLKNKDVPAYQYNDLKREHLMRTGSVVNHELYFENLGGNGKADGRIMKLISESFGSFTQWENEFKRIGNGLGGGPGWVILGYNKHLGILENYWAYDHMHASYLTEPMLIMDMYEHSYQIDYGAQAAKYIDAFIKNVNWDVVNKRLETLV